MHLVDYLDVRRIWFFEHPSSSESVLQEMCSRLVDEGAIKDTFLENVLRREMEYPTGLRSSGEIHVAVPHTDTAHVNHSTISLAILGHPIPFKEMGKPENTVPVRLVILLAFASSDLHLPVLGEVAQLIQNPSLLEQIFMVQDPESVYQLLQDLK